MSSAETTTREFSPLWLGAAITLLAGCGGGVTAANPGQADLPPAGPDGQYQADFPDPKQPEPRSLLMVVSEDLRADCRTPDPHFAFDESTPKPQSTRALEGLAECLQTDALAEHAVLLVGHADARGSQPYNEDLALSRARKAAKQLVDSGVKPDRLLLTSLGEQSAHDANDGYSHGFDRRVDILILDRTRAPEMSGVVPYIPVTEPR